MKQRKHMYCLSTYLSANKAKTQVMLVGIPHEIRNSKMLGGKDNTFNGFREIKGIHPLGPVFRLQNSAFGFVIAGAFAFRFRINDLMLISN